MGQELGNGAQAPTHTLKEEGVLYDSGAGFEYHRITSSGDLKNVRICCVKISDIKKIARDLTAYVQNTSWMSTLDRGTRRSYERTVAETTESLVKIFNQAAEAEKVAKDFGELVVSIGSAKALNAIYQHAILPLAELWKPQRKQNEGFDFHTTCNEHLVNFGEAKFSSSQTRHSKAINQAASFIKEEKHLRDRVHLINLVSDEAIINLDNDHYGVIAAFSIHAENPLDALKYAIETANKQFISDSIKHVYLVGVIN